jgi:hypothetical protein
VQPIAFVSPHRQTAPLAVATSPNSVAATLRGPEHRAIDRLADLVEEVVGHLETPAIDEPLYGAVAECNAALEVCLDAQREARVRESVVTARDELKRLKRLLIVAEDADSALVMRQIRRVLSRFDACRA